MSLKFTGAIWMFAVIAFRSCFILTCRSLHHPRMPGTVHVLPVAADTQRTSMAQAFDR